MDFNAFSKELNNIILETSTTLGKPINGSSLEIIDRGKPHKPEPLPAGKMGVYLFLYDDVFLKIGKAGPKSNARFYSQHYNPKSARSTLAASILSDKSNIAGTITESNIGDWIKENCHRIDILLDADVGIFALELIEAALHYKYEPIYEGFVTQR
ncbi:MAG: hypothetical protein GX367_10085 [Bacteroidales bacterium]|mgnify:CR=1 FL=1|nr:hypothetical protein [Bacteroidales bacterium]